MPSLSVVLEELGQMVPRETDKGNLMPRLASVSNGKANICEGITFIDRKHV